MLKRRFQTIIFIFIMLTIVPASATSSVPEQRMHTFINKLMRQMTLEEKVGQLTQYTAEMSVTGSDIKADYRNEIINGRVGSIFNAYTPEFTRQLQQIAVERSRLKIPLLFGYDVIHGHRTIFPIPLGESSSWDLARIEKSARIAAREASADGIHWAFGPMVDVTRDPRWGRIAEGSGEDPWLGAKIAAARVRGLQGPNLGATDSVLACVKHFAAYGAPIAGRDYNSVDMSERELLETYLPPYQAAVNAGVGTVMTSFNDINGVPSTANSWLVTKLLREQWKFKGFVVSDYTGISELVPHGVAADLKEAARLAFNAGVDMDMQGGVYAKYLPQLVREGKVQRARMDAAVRRVLEAKYKLGLFTDPYRFSNKLRAEQTLMSSENLAHARDVARRSIVLLKNENGILPLKKSGTVAVIGPLADDQRDMIGNWSAAGDWHKAVTVLEGLRQAVGPKAKILYARGANILPQDPTGVQQLKVLNENGGDIKNDPRSDEQLVREALKTARQADVVVVALGESQGMSGEAASRTRIRIPENQQMLLRALRKAGKPIVLLLFNGRPLVLNMENRLADAMLETWFLGTQAGPAIADVLFGDYNPSGKLTVSFPVDEGQIPIYYATRNTGRPFKPEIKYTSKYLDAPNAPLFSFGYGLSYTRFTFSQPRLSTQNLHMGQTLKVKVTLTNSGQRPGEEVAQLYIRDLVASVSRPVKQLRGFIKVALEPGESRELEFELNPDDLKFYDQNMKWVSEPGPFQVMVGDSSMDLKQASFNLLK